MKFMIKTSLIAKKLLWNQKTQSRHFYHTCQPTPVLKQPQGLTASPELESRRCKSQLCTF